MSKRIDDLIYVVLDNAPIHPKPGIEKDMERVPPNIKLVFLPTYAPELNRVEDINSLVQKEVLDNRKFESVDELKKALDGWVRNFNRKPIIQN
jgi:transposase